MGLSSPAEAERTRLFAKFPRPTTHLLVHQVRGWYSGAVAELAILERASEGPYLSSEAAPQTNEL